MIVGGLEAYADYRVDSFDALMGVIFAFLNIPDKVVLFLRKLSLEETLTKNMGEMPYYLLGVAIFAIMGYVLYRTAVKNVQEKNL